jgi:Na+-transporting NADH:ubiquinone oxidoreductase subunit B
VSAAATETGRLIYGFFVGVLVILIRVLNPAYPEGMMLSILFMNVFAPLIDYLVIQRSARQRMARLAAAPAK